MMYNPKERGKIMSGLKPYLFLVLGSAVVLLTGCASFNSLDSKIVPPTLIEKPSLPPPPPALAQRDFYLRMEILVGKDGSVRHVTLLKSSGDEVWDSAAMQRVMEWKYSPALLDDKPIQMRIIQAARVISSVPVMMDLSEIVCAKSSQADSAYALLKAGASFDSTAAIYGSSVPIIRSGHIGEVDIHQFPDDIQAEISALRKGDFTHPLPLGPYLAIFMRH
ncbi:MAG: energy transducer TonB [Bacteroidetes bacterium]|nr:energy transducer TonB [Bacteroidota bacterium]